jgi:hypothetical protein
VDPNAAPNNNGEAGVVDNIPEEEYTLDAAEHIPVVVVHNKDLLSHNLLKLRQMPK